MGTVMTVLGPVNSSTLGNTITHEHLFIDLTCYLVQPNNPSDAAILNEPVSMKNLYYMRSNPYGNRDNCILNDIDLASREVNIFKKFGGNSIVDLTVEGIGRNVEGVAEISRRTGINLIAGCGHYIYSAHPENLYNMSIDQLAQQYIDEIKNGVGKTGIRPGIIGEIGTGYDIHPQELKVLQAAACAQVETGLPISIHLHPPKRRGHEVLDILIGEGVPPEKIILSHLCPSLVHSDIEFDQGVEYIMSLASRGCYIQFDLCGNSTHFITKEASWWLPSDRERAKALAIFCRNGFSNRILLSHDVGHKYYLREYGGWGYSHVLNEFQVYLSEAGIEPQIAKRFTIDNPACVLTIER